MNDQSPDRFGGKREGVMALVRPRSRELAERSSNGTQVRLLWRQGTRQLWVEVREPDERLRSRSRCGRSGRSMPSITLTPTPACTVSYSLPESLAASERRPQSAARSAVGIDPCHDGRPDRAHRAGDRRCRVPARLLPAARGGGLAASIGPRHRSSQLRAGFLRRPLGVVRAARRRRDVRPTSRDRRGLCTSALRSDPPTPSTSSAASIAAAGHRVLEPPHRAGELGRYESVVLDPDGNRVKLTV